MKRIAAFAFATLTSLLIAGCAITSDSSSGGQYPVLKVLTDKPYVWDDSISEALNVAQMAMPAGVGNGMRDFSDGKIATTGRIGAGLRTFDAGVGLIGQGIFGVIIQESLSRGVNKQLEWKPAVVQLVPMSEISSNGEISFEKTQKIVVDEIKNAVGKTFKEISWGPTLTPKNANLSNTSISVTSLDICKSNFDFISINKNHKGYLEHKYSKFFINGGDVQEKHCLISLKISVAGVDSNNNAIVVSEVISGDYFNDGIAKNHRDYFIVPDVYFVRASDSAKDISVYADYARVYKNGSELLFQK